MSRTSLEKREDIKYAVTADINLTMMILSTVLSAESP